jgi:DNA replication protein DnaC
VAATICRALRYAPRWASWPDVTNRVAESWKGGPDDTINLLLRCSFLVLDDFGKEVAGDDDETRAQGWRREVAFRLINGRYERNLQTVITTELTPQAMASRFDQSITSRLVEHGVWIDLSSEPDRRVRYVGR